MSDFADNYEERIDDLERQIRELEEEKYNFYMTKYEEALAKVTSYVGKCYKYKLSKRAICVLLPPRRMGQLAEAMVKRNSYPCHCIMIDDGTAGLGLEERDVDISFLFDSPYWEECSYQDFYDIGSLVLTKRVLYFNEMRQRNKKE